MASNRVEFVKRPCLPPDSCYLCDERNRKRQREQVGKVENKFDRCVSVCCRPDCECECACVLRRTLCILLVSFFHCAHCFRIAVVFNSSVHINTNAKTKFQPDLANCVQRPRVRWLAGTQDWWIDGRRAATEMSFCGVVVFVILFCFFHSDGVCVCVCKLCARPPYLGRS